MRRDDKSKAIALERIQQLFIQAELTFHSEPKLANRYVELARKISMRCKAPIPRELKRRFCKKCGQYLVAGVNCRIRTRDSKLVSCCLSCKAYKRHPF